MLLAPHRPSDGWSRAIQAQAGPALLSAVELLPSHAHEYTTRIIYLTRFYIARTLDFVMTPQAYIALAVSLIAAVFVFCAAMSNRGTR